jgi:hypothetical protein
MSRPVTMQSQLIAFIHESMPARGRERVMFVQIPGRTEIILIIHWPPHIPTT